MNLTIGHIPYLNMVPFHQGFGPGAIEKDGHALIFRSLSPRALGLEAEAGQIDAGAISLVDTFRLADRFEPLGDLGVGPTAGGQSTALGRLGASDADHSDHQPAHHRASVPNLKPRA